VDYYAGCRLYPDGKSDYRIRPTIFLLALPNSCHRLLIRLSHLIGLPIQRRLVYRAQLWYCSTSAGIGALQVDYYAGCAINFSWRVQNPSYPVFDLCVFLSWKLVQLLPKVHIG
jgi:hypothetical protein